MHILLRYVVVEISDILLQMSFLYTKVALLLTVVWLRLNKNMKLGH